MGKTDTVNLLMECDAGSKMAVVSIEEIMEKTQDDALREMLDESKRRHTELGKEMHRMLTERGAPEKDPPAMAKGMSWLKTNWKMGMHQSDATIAELMTDGCNMGVKSLHEFLNEYSGADDDAKRICRKLASLEEQLCKDLQPYL